MRSWIVDEVLRAALVVFALTNVLLLAGCESATPSDRLHAGRAAHSRTERATPSRLGRSIAIVSSERESDDPLLVLSDAPSLHANGRRNGCIGLYTLEGTRLDAAAEPRAGEHSLGAHLAVVGDLDGDDVQDFVTVVARLGQDSPWQLQLRSGSTLAVLREREAPEGGLIASLHAMPDVDGDGTDDVLLAQVSTAASCFRITAVSSGSLDALSMVEERSPGFEFGTIVRPIRLDESDASSAAVVASTFDSRNGADLVRSCATYVLTPPTLSAMARAPSDADHDRRLDSRLLVCDVPCGRHALWIDSGSSGPNGMRQCAALGLPGLAVVGRWQDDSSRFSSTRTALGRAGVSIGDLDLDGACDFALSVDVGGFLPGGRCGVALFRSATNAIEVVLESTADRLVSLAARRRGSGGKAMLFAALWTGDAFPEPPELWRIDLEPLEVRRIW